MENKLQELTEKIYAEGVDKANKEAQQIIDNARAEVEKMQEKAREDAGQIIEKAKKEAEEIKKNVNSEVKLSARQAINTIKQQITGLVTAKATGENIKEAFKEKEFLQKIIEVAVKNWDPKSGKTMDVAVLLPEKDKKELDDYFNKKQKALLDAGLEIRFDDSVVAGFKIGPKDGSYQISFTDEDFENFFKNYIRPRTKELLYPEEK
ncbi:MAG: V-type ATP synthase subunit E [Marinilabiliales bacterium]|nr:MAG: V-type ATP synthase subunit E [Marinilabiliales bacterium]